MDSVAKKWPKLELRSGPIACPDYERYWRLGYGPPGGDKMDEAGWDKYFDEMPQAEYFKMMTHEMKTYEYSFCNNQTGVSEIEEEWVGWLEKLDKDLTSRSEIFKLYPQYQLMYQNGFAPRDALNCDLHAWQVYYESMDYHKRRAMLMDLFHRPRDHRPRDHHYNGYNHDRYRHELWVQYQDQFSESEGFDIDVYLTHGYGVIKPIFNHTRPVHARIYHMLSNYSSIAVDYYNQLTGTYYTLNRVVKACHQNVNGMLYFITFEAKNSEDHFHVFQAEVYVEGIKPGQVLLVRRKAMAGMPSETQSNKMKDLFTPPLHSHQAAKLWETYLKQIKESEGFDIDVYPTDGRDIWEARREAIYCDLKALELYLENLDCKRKDIMMHGDYFKPWIQYHDQFIESKIFDIDVYLTDGRGIIKPMFNDTSPVSAEIYYMLIYCSRISVDAYNQWEGTDYTVNRVVKVCTQTDCGITFFITFEAIKPKDHFQVFQAMVYYDPIDGEYKVLLVRPKAMVKDFLLDAKCLGKYVEQIKETEGFDIDVCISDGDGTIVPVFHDVGCETPDYRFLIDYSRNALAVYNFREGTDYTLCKVVRACAQTLAARMYYITFKAMSSNNGLQVFQAKVFDPANGQIEVLLVRRKATDGMPTDTHSNKMNGLFTPPCDSHQVAKLWETYLKQIKDSEGFDIDVYPTVGCGIIKPMFNYTRVFNDTSAVSPTIYLWLIHCSRISVDAYNQREGTDYTVIRVVKVCTQTDCGIMLFITFEAIKPKDHFQVFQAMVYHPIDGGYKVLLVRPKAMVKDFHHDAKRLGKYVDQIKETEGFDIDVCISDGDGTIVPVFPVMSRAKTELITYSRNALTVYNLREGTDYTFYELFKACAQTLAGQMYYITFEAINSNYDLQVFQAKVFDPAKGRVEVLQVRCKA